MLTAYENFLITSYLANVAAGPPPNPRLPPGEGSAGGKGAQGRLVGTKS